MGKREPTFLDDEARWRAVLERDGSADGLFYYAVRTSGVYCRPTCPSRRPGRSSVVFFETAEAAEAAGFRPCRRCRPDEVSSIQRVVAEVRRMIEAANAPLTLAQFGRAVNLSPYHLQRVFKRATGLTPRQYSTALRGRRLKDGLKHGSSVSEAMYDAGYGSARALYDQAHHLLGMTPGRYRGGGLGETIRYAFEETDLGTMIVAATEKGVCALRFGHRKLLLGEMRAEFPRARLIADPLAVAPYVEAAAAHLSGRRSDLDLPLDIVATAFQQRVWATVRAIPYGQTRSYREVAEAIGRPGAARAVATACAANPVGLLVPCHRVVRADGGLSGYRWGIDRKRALLDLEGSS
ncbi:MAG TPA: bifunctional DNA-binding transcriptional regulator/O6-methylguanine-DNA methyltransferase Ada [Bacillota bacterium]|jgi:AraC family transcriptional regulator of adaptative response/methylated-DNA-[protein]-cysteine methyltransferase